MKTYSSWLGRSFPVLLLALLVVLAKTTKAEDTQESPVPEIVGGSIADGANYPFFALLYRTRTDANSYICGGTLIKSDVVLTAAHCFDNGRIVRYVNIGPTLSFVQQEYIEVDSITLHPRYNKDSPTRDYDFAIVKLKEHSTAIPASINLDTKFPLLAGTPLESIGFGADEDGEPTQILKRVDLSFVPFDICEQNFFPGIAPNLHDCAEGFPPEDALCDGDDGGPLLLLGTDLLIGVLSFGAECGTPGVDVFSKVADNFHWISTTAGFPPTAPPTHAPTMKPTKDSDSDSDDSKVTPAPTPRPTSTVPCQWFWELGDMFWEWVKKVENTSG